MARKTNEEKRREFATRQRSLDPVLTKENYRNDLLNYTNYHNKNTDTKVLRKWALQYVETQNKKIVSVVNKASDYELRSLGMLSRALMRGDYVAEEHVEWVQKDIQSLVGKYSVKEEKVKDVKQEVPVKDKNDVMYSKHRAEVDGAIDEYILHDTPFSMKGYAIANNVSGTVLRRIGDSFLGLCQELRAAIDGSDDDLKTAYSHLGKVKLKRFYALIQQIVAECQQQVIAVKTPRKPRAKKEKPAQVLVAALKYLKECTELGLKSEEPKSIVNSQQVWLYDTEKRKIFVYSAEKGKTLSVKGTTLLNWDVSVSGCKTLRKPELFLKGSLAKKTIMQNYDGLTTKAQQVNGRTNDKMIILKVF